MQPTNHRRCSNVSDTNDTTCLLSAQLPRLADSTSVSSNALIEECLDSLCRGEFILRRDQAPKEHSLFITHYSLDAYNQMQTRLFLSSCGNGGYGITGDGELISVFSLPGAQLGAALISHANDNGARYLYCFDWNQILPRIYGRFGYIETNRYVFDPEQAPSGWNYELLGTPDVIRMERW